MANTRPDLVQLRSKKTKFGRHRPHVSPKFGRTTFAELEPLLAQIGPKLATTFRTTSPQISPLLICHCKSVGSARGSVHRRDELPHPSSATAYLDRIFGSPPALCRPGSELVDFHQRLAEEARASRGKLASCHALVAIAETLSDVTQCRPQSLRNWPHSPEVGRHRPGFRRSRLGNRPCIGQRRLNFVDVAQSWPKSATTWPMSSLLVDADGPLGERESNREKTAHILQLPKAWLSAPMPVA